MRSTIRNSLLLVAIGGFTCSWVTQARAQADDPAARAAARELGNQGVQAYQQGDYATASERLQRAYQVIRAPSLALWLARSLVARGMLVEASEIFLQATRIPIVGGERAVQEQAQKDAAADRAALLPRLAGLTVAVDGAAGGQALVTVDGVSIADALIGVDRPTNPGTRIVEVTCGGHTERQELSLSEGQHQTARFQCAPSPPVATGPGPGPEPGTPGQSVAPASQPAPAQAPPIVAPSTGQGAPEADQGAARATPWYTYVAWSVAGAGIALGAGTGYLAIEKRDTSELKQGCSGTSCSPNVEAAVNDYNDLRTLSTIGFVVGGVGLASAAFLQWMLPSLQDSGSGTAHVEGTVQVGAFPTGPSQAGLSLSGRF